jgi:hypothetical protein
VRNENTLTLRRIKKEKKQRRCKECITVVIITGKEQEINSLNVPGQCPPIILEDKDHSQCRAMGGEEGRLRERVLLGIYSKRLFDHLD